MTAIRPQEQLLLDALPELSAGRLLVNTAGRAQFAAAFAARDSASRADCWLLDLYQTDECRRAFVSPPANLRLLCQADPPAEEVDIVAWAFQKQGDGELAREMLQTGHERLAIGGRMACAIDNPRDQWLHEQLQSIFPKVTRRASDSGVLYLATKTAPLKKLKNYAAEFTFKDGEHTRRLRTRPGVFSHRELDGGARALLKSTAVQPAQRVLDLGCGSGAVGVAAALRAAEVHVHCIDSNPRAIEATLWAAVNNELVDRVTATLDCDGRSVSPASFDLVLANPPYYSNFRLAELFLRIAARALRPGGRVLVVTKTPDWYAERCPGASLSRSGAYYVVEAARSIIEGS